ncbi:MAG: hypothetical protein U0872_09960 [Planctomycetaceae bacterium]
MFETGTNQWRQEKPLAAGGENHQDLYLHPLRELAGEFGTEKK